MKPRLQIALTVTALAAISSLVLMGLSGSWSLLAAFQSGDSATITLGVLSLLLIVVIPLTWALLYIAKVGPASWHAPTSRDRERAERRRELVSRVSSSAEAKVSSSAAWATKRGTQAKDLSHKSAQLAKKQLNEWKNLT